MIDFVACEGAELHFLLLKLVYGVPLLYDFVDEMLVLFHLKLNLLVNQQFLLKVIGFERAEHLEAKNVLMLKK